MTHLIDILERFANHKIALVGDLMLDRYIFGSTERVSPEAPVPIIHFHREEYRLGGAGFVMANLATLGANVHLIAVIGKDDAGKTVREHLSHFKSATISLIESPTRPTVLKVRMLGSSQDRTPHQMLRLDIESSDPLDGDIASQIIAQTERALNDGAELLCLEDYNKGVLSKEVTQRLIQLARARNIPVIIDPANIPDYTKYKGATALKLNRPESERSTGLPLRAPDHYEPAANALLDKLELDAVVITLNEQGSYLAVKPPSSSRTRGEGGGEGLTSLSTQDPGLTPEHRWIQTRPRQVADGTGAGDTLLAALSIARAAGADWPDAVALGNIAAGLEVEKLGCVPITREEIIQDLLSEAHQHLGKLRSLEALLPELARHRAMGKKIVFTNGCFDLIHLGHVKYFQFAKSQGDLLVVGVNTDVSIRRLKGDKRPIIHEDDRTQVLEELESIDYLIKFDDDTPLRLIESIKPDVLVKGADYTKDKVVGADYVESCGGTIALAPLINGRSTSNLIQRILEAYK